MRKTSDATPSLVSCLIVVALIGILVRDQMWAARERAEIPASGFGSDVSGADAPVEAGGSAFEPEPAGSGSRSTPPAVETEPKADPRDEREPPRNRVRAYLTMPA